MSHECVDRIVARNDRVFVGAESMLVVRLHLDDCGEDNGPLRVLPGSHRLGRLTSEQIQRVTEPP